MRCEEVKKLIDVHADGALDESAATEIERHLIRCASCAHEVRSLELTIRLLRSTAADATASNAFVSRTAAKLRAELAPHLTPAPAPAAQGRQWVLPFSADDRRTGTD